MTATTSNDECVLKWCNEAGDHDEHRQYVTSLVAWRSTWLIGVNIVQSDGEPLHVELTATTRWSPPATVTLKPDEAEAVAQALLEAATRAVR
ncbi:hypothetical protein [Jiangella alkaliphila]|jgi:hypothetical protein|uniref:Uncharacterized protein n=1 Tax=Jiangella alkaliphila TaxID=419479 RepID=A0A1H2K7Z2_9ACTN|nr:hypothetical protein [Jiangella alkaliphila]SDU64571.1 hypothetical protein SAMN04488563_3509 [Jiangella alkaliphila]